MEIWQTIIAVVGSVLASSGVWTLIIRKNDRKSAKMKLLLGIACDRIVSLGMMYINRGYITKDEYETLHDYLWLPYSECGGNGTAARVMGEVEKLEMRANNDHRR